MGRERLPLFFAHNLPYPLLPSRSWKAFWLFSLEGKENDGQKRSVAQACLSNKRHMVLKPIISA